MTKCVVCGSEVYALMQKDMFSYNKCINCKLEFILPQPDENQLNDIYGKNYYNTWGLHESEKKVSEVKSKTFKQRLLLIKDMIPSNATILDCGCATGFFMDVAKQKGYSVYGIDISSYAIVVCKEKHGEQRVFHGSIEEFSVSTQIQFDAIFMSDYLEHVKNPKSVLKVAFNLLKPQGVIIITTPDTDSMSKKIMQKSWPHYKTEHLFYYNKSNLAFILNQIGFKDISKKIAWKTLNFQYVIFYFYTFKHKFISPVLMMLKQILPQRVLFFSFKFSFGDMTIIARKDIT